MLFRSSEQRKAITILREGENAAQRAEASVQRPEREPRPPDPWPGADTMAGPVPSRTGGTDWSEHSSRGPSLIRPAPTTFSHAYGPGHDFRRPAAPMDSKRKQWIIVGAIALISLVAFIVAVAGYLSTRSSAPTKQASGQSVMPFNGIDFRLSPGGVALDSAGDVYVTSEGMYGRVVKLSTG